MPTKHAVYDVAFKAIPDDDGEERGRFEAIVSTVGNVDKVGDRVMDGAFTKSLEEWRASGDPIPVIWSHQWGNPDAHIGGADPFKAEEILGVGLKIVGDVDLSERFSAKVYKLMKGRLVSKFSFAYDVIKERRAKDGANELVELRLLEVGPTLVPVNESTQLLAIKSELEEAAEPEVKAGRSISTKNESRIRMAVESLNEVLGSLGDPEEEKQDDDDAGTAKADAGTGSVDVTLLELQAQLMKVKEK